jgi:uncharacterized protein YggE
MMRDPAFVVVLLALPALALAQGMGEMRVSGSASAEVMPDVAGVNFTVRAEAPQAAAARAQAAQVADKVMDAIRALHIEGLTLSTQSVSARPVIKAPQGASPEGYYGGDVEIKRDILGYSVANSVAVKITGSVEKLASATPRVIDAALAAGATSLEGPYFTASDLTAARTEALVKATKDALREAEALARGLGVTIVGHPEISTYPRETGGGAMYGGMGPGMMGTGMGGGMGMGPGAPPGGPPTPVEIQPVSVQASVWLTVKYEEGRTG